MSKRIGRSPEEQALFDYQDAGKEFVEGGAASYQNGNDFNYTKQGNVQQLGDSAYKDIATNPEYETHQLEALRQLEEQSKDGYSARDKADLARIEQSANRANQGRQGAIKQNMAARGIGGGGLEVVMQQQAAQDAAEQQALQSLETNAQMQDRKQAAVSQLGQLSGQLQANQYNQQAQAASAKDAISRFNVQNAVNTQQADNQGVNAANQTNHDRRNQVADNNVNAGYTYRKDALGVGQQNAQQHYNTIMDQKNYELAKKAAKSGKKSGQNAAIGAGVGAIAGGLIGTFVAPGVGTAAGAQMGAGLGGAAGSAMAHGGRVHGPEISPFDDPANDIIPITVSAGEVVLPKSVASDPQAAAQFVAKENARGMDPRILDRLAGKNPDLVNKYKSQMDGANKGVDDANKTAEYGQYANIAGKILNDYGNSQKQDTIYHNNWSKMGNAPEIDRAERKEYDGSAITAATTAGQSKAQQRLAGIKASMAADYQAQKDMDKETEDRRRYDQDFGLKKDGLNQSDAHFNAEMGQKQWASKQAADQFGQTMGLNRDKFGEEVRNHKAEEGLKGDALVAKAATEKAPSADQSKAASFATRVKQAEDVFTKLKGEGYDRSDVTSGLGSMLPGSMMSSQGQQQEQAERNFVNSVLRRESGAAISPTEFKSAELQYFPRTGDSPEVIAQKKANREQVFNNLKAESANAYDKVEKVGGSAPVFDFDAEDRRRGLK